MPSKKFDIPTKVVLDTNNLVSSLISYKGASFKIYQLFRNKQIILFTSPFQLRELERVLNYPRIKKKYRLNLKSIKQFITLLQNYSHLVYPLEIPKIINEDPADNQILAIATEARVDLIISGDEHLLKLRCYQDIPIFTAQEFLHLVTPPPLR